MTHFWNTVKRYSGWLLILLCTDIFSALLLWLSDVDAFYTLIGVVVLWSLVLYTTVLFVTMIQEKKKQKQFQNFIENPDEVNAKKLFAAVSHQELEQLRILASVLHEKQNSLGKLQEELRDYEEYVEGWAHEAKTPLSLLIMILDNRADEIPVPLQAKLNYVRSQLQEDITQMLYYARLKSSTKDYCFEFLNVQSILEEVLEDYAPLLEEKGFVIQNRLGNDLVFSDRRGLGFILSQIISNAIKYCGEAPVLTVSMEHTEEGAILLIQDNGVGVRSHDLPYIFQKGFTGDSTDSRKKATGMGLYLTKKMADDLKLKLEAKSEWKKGFSMTVMFPHISES